MKTRWVFLRLSALVVALSAMLAPVTNATPAYAGGVVGNGTSASCTEAALTTALSGGGAVTFNCGGPKTILVLSEKNITQTTTIDGGGVITITGGLTTRLFNVNASASLALSNITLDSAFNSNGSGGAIWSAGPLTLTNVTIQYSKTSLPYCGGALLVAGDANITHSTFNSNVAGLGGGAICVRSQPGTQVQVTDSSFFSNQAVDTTNGLGGAIYVEYGTAAVLDSVFLFNSAHFGGAVYASLDNATITLEGSATSTPFASKLQLNANTATEDGGAIYNKSGVMTINNAVITVNRTPTQTLLAGYGGAIYNEGALTLTNSILSLNEGRFGGGLFLGAVPAPSSGPYVRVQSVTVSGNTVTSNQGGGVLNTGLVELYSMTIVTNTNGVWSGGNGNTRFRDTVLQNPGSLNCDGDGTAQISDESHNFSTDNSCPLPNSQTGLGLDPQLGPLTVDALGPTFYHMPLAGSPLINAGFNCPERDQRGALRPDACDIGAVEYGGLLPRIYMPLVLR